MAGCCDLDPKKARDLTASPVAWLLCADRRDHRGIFLDRRQELAMGLRLCRDGDRVRGQCQPLPASPLLLHRPFVSCRRWIHDSYSVSFGLSACQSIFADCAGSCLRIPMC